MATLRDDLLLSLDVYDPSGSVGGWTRIAKDSDDTSGFAAAAYQKGNQIVISFRGWDDFDPRDAVNIERMYAGKPFEQIKDAQHFVDQILAAHPGANISLTGHSLGGALAAIMAVRNGLHAETFAADETVGAAFNSMNGYTYDPFGITLWKIPDATHNQNITEAELGSYPDVTNHLVYGEIASYNDHTHLFTNQIGVDDVIGKAIKNGILKDDSKFGDYLNTVGTAFTNIVPAHVEGAPYSEAFSTAIHSLGFHALTLVFAHEIRPLWTELPRLAFQLTNDLLATEQDGGGFYRATFDFLDTMMFDHLSQPSGTTTVATAMIDDLKELASAGPDSSALASPDINTALLQLNIQYAATQTLGSNAHHLTDGLLTNHGDFVEAALQGGPKWDNDIAPRGYTLISDFADSLLGDAAGLVNNAAGRAHDLLVEAKNGSDATITSPSDVSDLIFGGTGDDTITGGSAGDTAFGRDGSDVMAGGQGSDVLAGEGGRDHISGGDGDDVLIGGIGMDVLTGGAGADRFVFTSLMNGTSGDHIAGFTPGLDQMVFDNDVFTALGGKGALSPDAFFTGTAAHDGDDRLIYNDATGALLYDSDGNGPTGAIRVATLDTGLNLSADDFRII